MNRRLFLRYLQRSPLYALAAEMAGQPARKPLSSAKDALDVFDFLPLAEKNVQPQHWAYLMGGSDDDATVRANENAFSQWQIRARRQVDVDTVDTSVTLFGQKQAYPIWVAPAAAQQAFHPDGEAATARGASARKAQMVLSTNASLHVKDVAPAFGGPLWYQLYTQAEFEVSRALVGAAEQAGCTVLAITVDSATASNRVTAARGGQKTEQRCRACHGLTYADYYKEHGMFAGIDPLLAKAGGRAVTWTLVERLRAATKMKIVIKGIMTAEDAAVCLRNGVDGIVVSNHGGRSENSLQGTMEALPEIVETINGRIPVLIDGGFRRGTDVFKALAIGATAVGIGRPYIWGLSAFGQEGVERVLELIQTEFAITMKLAGTVSTRHISPMHVRRRNMGA
ncbi:MAG: alpha-hydroxy-acid oxidizing protein [Acidobacteria bacterium]|nr:alpha-hydroxy-acid oxidizing protein [Acidobacteriota bacterium]